MPVVTSSGLQPGNVAFTIFLWFRHVVLRPFEIFLHIIRTLYMNENDHLIGSLTHNSTEFHQALPKFEMFDTNLCIWQNSKLQRHIWVCNQKFVVLSEVFFKVVYLSEVVFVALDLFHGIVLYTGTPGQPPPQPQYRDVPVS